MNDEDLTLGGRTYHRVTIQPGTVGYLSDYFDQKAQSDLADESQAGATPAPSPSAWTDGLHDDEQHRAQLPSGREPGDVQQRHQPVPQREPLHRPRCRQARTVSLGRLYVNGNLNISGPVNFSCSRSPRDRQSYRRQRAVDAVQRHVQRTGPCDRGDRHLRQPRDQRDDPVRGGNIKFTGLTSSTQDARYQLVYANSTSSTTTLVRNVQLYTSETSLNGNFTISGATLAPVKNWLGHIYVLARPTADTGIINWSGYGVGDLQGLPAAVGSGLRARSRCGWAMKWSRTGDYDDEYGPTWVPGNSSLSVDFNSTAASTIMCPLLCTTEQNIWKGNVQYGTREVPMVFFFMCDNNGIYPMVFEYQGTGTYYGLMVINESTMTISNGSSTKPSIQGAIFAGCPYDPTITTTLSESDIVLKNASCVAYDQYVVGKIATSSLKTTTLVTGIVPGSWQQLLVTGD